MYVAEVGFQPATPGSTVRHAIHCAKEQQDLSPDRIARLILHILFLGNSKFMTLILT